MKKTLKMMLSLLLVVLCLAPSVALCAEAAGTLDYPIVYVAGKFTWIYNKNESKRLYPLDPPLATVIKNNATKLVAAYTTSNTTGNWKVFSDAIYNTIEPIYRELKLNGAGEITNGSHIKPVAEPKVKSSNFKLEDYMFTYDSRLDPYENAAALHTYIKKVMKNTGKTRINLIGRCLGTTVVSTYLTKYGCDHVESVAFYASAFNGVHMMDSFFTGDISFNANQIDYYLDHGLNDEDGTYDTIKNLWDVLRTLGLGGFGTLTANEVWNNIADDLLPRMVRAVFGTWPGHWAMISADHYQKAKSVVFGDCMTEYAALIKKTDKYQKEVMSVFPKTLDNMVKKGLKVINVSKYNTPLAPLSEGSSQQADGTVELKTMSLGATCANMGKMLSNEYIKLLKSGKTRADGKKYTDKYLSADQIIDASTCQYPDYTWFIRDVAHDAYPSEINAMFMEFFHSKTQYTITTNSKYPQFVSYDKSKDKISKVTEPLAADTASSNNFLSKIADYIISFLMKIMSFFGMGTQAA